MKRIRTWNAESEDESLGQGATSVDFDFDDPAESDFHIVKTLVQQSLDGADFDSSGLADVLIDKVRMWLHTTARNHVFSCNEKALRRCQCA